MRWLLLLLTVFAVVACFTCHSSGAMACWLFVGIVGAFATVLAFAQARISGSARSETLSSYDLQRLREGKNPLDRE
jgi:uncharacterized YccA/Bax inhibitor family protein